MPGQDREARLQIVGLGKDRAVELVEAARNLAGQLDVRHLVLADRHHVASDHQDVGGLQDGIVEQTQRRGFELQVADLVLEGRDALGAGGADQHREQQEQLGDLRDQRLQVEGALARVDPNGEKVEQAVADVVADGAGLFVAGGQGVVVGDQEEALVVAAILQLEIFFKCPDVVPQVELAGGTQPRQEPLAGDLAVLLRYWHEVVLLRDAKRLSSIEGTRGVSWCHPHSPSGALTTSKRAQSPYKGTP